MVSFSIPRKVIIDCDPGIDDAVALCMALFEPRLEVMAVTAVAGNVPAGQATLNVQAVIDQLDPPRLPRVGSARSLEGVGEIKARLLHGKDGLGGTGVEVSQLHQQHAAEKIISDQVRSAPGEITIICLGPLTNIARAVHRDPELPALIGQIILSSGSINGRGNATPAAEFNIHSDPYAAKTVLQAVVPKLMIPLEVSEEVKFDMGFIRQLPSVTTRAGRLLRRIIPFSFRAYHQHMGRERIQIPDAVALLAAIQPELFEIQSMTGDIETQGELTVGATVFDYRPLSNWGYPLDVAHQVDSIAAKDCIIRCLSAAGEEESLSAD